MGTQQNTFGELRSLLQRPPSRKGWERLCAMIEGWPAARVTERDEVAIPYALDHLASWPDLYRTPTPVMRRAILRREVPTALLLCTTLSLESSHTRRIANATIIALASSPAARSLRTLQLNGAPIGLPAAHALGASPHLAQLRTLELNHARLGPDGAAALATPQLAALECLSVADTQLTDAGMRHLLGAPFAAQLEFLDARRNRLTDATADHIERATALRHLRNLHLDDNALTNHGAQVLANTPHLATLRELTLDTNDIGRDGLAMLANSPHLNHTLISCYPAFL